MQRHNCGDVRAGLRWLIFVKVRCIDLEPPLTLETKKALMVVLDRFTAGRPCELVASMPCKPHLLFSDGALEYDEHDNPRATIGCVLMQRDGIILCSGCVVPDQLLGMWQAGGRTRVIGLVELYVVGLSTWKKVFRNDRVILLTDSCHKCIWHIQRFVWNVQTTLF